MLLRKLASSIKLSLRTKYFIIIIFFLFFFRKILLLFKSNYAYSEVIIPLFKKENNNNTYNAYHIKKAIKIFSKNIKYKNVCRDQAWCASVLLLYYKISFEYVVGLKKVVIEDDERGHCWVLSNNKFVSGLCNPKEYNIISSIKA